MPFSYKRKISELVQFYHSMKKLSVAIGTFEHEYNGVNSHVIFETRTCPFMLHFIEHRTGRTFSVPIEPGFVFSVPDSTSYYAMLDYFNIKRRGRGTFQIGGFITSFRRQIPPEYAITDAEREVVNRYDPIDRTSEGIYPVGVKNWAVINAKRAAKGFSALGHRSQHNLEKTRELYPEIYQIIKTMDISICYGLSPGNKTEAIKTGSF